VLRELGPALVEVGRTAYKVGGQTKPERKTRENKTRMKMTWYSEAH